MPLVSPTKLSHHKLSKLLKCFCLDIDATRTALLVGVNRKTSNRFFEYLRRAVYRHQHHERTRLIGETELDESYFGAKRKRGFAGKLKRGRGTLKQPVFGMLKRNGRVYTEIVLDAKKRTLQALILGRIAKESVIYTDGWRG